MEDFNSKIIELASNLAEETVWNDYSDILSTKEDMFKQPRDNDYEKDCLTYKDTDNLPIQDTFNDTYDYFFTEISKVFKEPKIYVMNANNIDSDELLPKHKDFDKNKFIEKAESLGKIYSLSGFQNAINNEEINTSQNFTFINK